MNRAELVAQIAQKTGHRKTDVEQILSGFETATSESLKRGEPLRLVGFGTLMPHERAARKGRNPRTGEVIEIPATRRVNFKPGKDLLRSINEK